MQISSSILVCALVVQILLSPVSGHMPSGYKLKVTTQIEDYSVRIVVFPAKPEVNKSSEIIVGIINSRTNAPFSGEVRVNSTPARRFSQAFYEVKLTFTEEGNHTVPVEFSADGKTLRTAVNVEVVRGSDSSWLILGGLFTFLTSILACVWYLKRRQRGNVE